MTKFHIIDATELIKSQTGYFIDLASVNQDLIPEHSEEDLECLDDFIDKIDHQTIKVENNGFAAYIRTAPIEKLNIPETEKKEEPKKGLLRRLFGSSKADEGPKTSGTTNKVFGVDFKGLETQVFGRKTEQGTVYDIFINTNKHAIDKIRKDINDNLDITVDVYLEPVKTGTYNEDIRRAYKRMADFFGSLAELYDKVGIREGNLVLNTDFDGARERIKDLRKKGVKNLKEGRTFGNTTFYEMSSMYERFDSLDLGKTDHQDKKASPKKDKPRRSYEKNGKENITFDDVIGLDEQVKKFRSAIKYFKDPEEYRRNRGDLGLESGCILYGPPGTGKTHLAKAFANEAGVPLRVYKGSDLFNKWVGESEKAIASMFEDAKKLGKCVIFVDEIDQIARSRDMSDGHPVRNNVVNMLLTELQGFEESGDVYFLGTTNRMEDIDPAIKRRLGKIEIGLPTYEARKAMVKKTVEDHAKKAEVSPYGSPFADLDYNTIAEASKGLSGSDLVYVKESIFRDLCEIYYDACDDGKNPAKITTEDWLDKIKNYKPKEKGRMGFHKGE